MGALSRMRTYFQNWLNAKFWNKYAFVQRFPSDLLTMVPGLTVGGLGLADFPQQNGETQGELFLTNDTTPRRLFIWAGGEWYEIGLTQTGGV